MKIDLKAIKQRLESDYTGPDLYTSTYEDCCDLLEYAEALEKQIQTLKSTLKLAVNYLKFCDYGEQTNVTEETYRENGKAKTPGFCSSCDAYTLLPCIKGHINTIEDRVP